MIKVLTFATLLSASMAHAFTVEVRDSQANPIQLSVDALGTVESALATDVRHPGGRLGRANLFS